MTRSRVCFIGFALCLAAVGVGCGSSDSPEGDVGSAGSVAGVLSVERSSARGGVVEFVAAYQSARPDDRSSFDVAYELLNGNTKLASGMAKLLKDTRPGLSDLFFKSEPQRVNIAPVAAGTSLTILLDPKHQLAPENDVFKKKTFLAE